MKTAYLSATLLAILITGGVGYVLYSSESTRPTDGAWMMEVKTLAERTIVDSGEAVNGVVPYSYLGTELPEKLAEDEVVELRTNTSYTRHLGTEGTGKEARAKLRTVVYSQPAFAKDAAGKWKSLEYATTTEAAFIRRDATLAQRVMEYMVRSAYAVTTSPFSGAGDGYITSGPTGAFSTCRTAASGTFSNNTNTTAAISVYRDTVETSDCTVGRAFFPFDTSGIPSTATISAATLNLYVTATTNQANDGSDFVTVSTSTTASETSLSTADFNDAGPATLPTASECIDAGTRKDITSVSTSAYLSFAFNAAGIAAIKLSGQTSTCGSTPGFTCLSVREGHDTTPTTPANQQTSSVTFSTSEETGTGQDPYMDITYTAPSSFAFWMWSDF